MLKYFSGLSVPQVLVINDAWLGKSRESMVNLQKV